MVTEDEQVEWDIKDDNVQSSKVKAINPDLNIKDRKAEHIMDDYRHFGETEHYEQRMVGYEKLEMPGIDRSDSYGMVYFGYVLFALAVILFIFLPCYTYPLVLLLMTLSFILIGKFGKGLGGRGLAWIFKEGV